MAHTRQNAWLQYWHAQLNRMFFDGKLEPAIIHVFTEDDVTWFDDGGWFEVDAEFQGRLNPFRIVFHHEPNLEDDKSALLELGTLLHEMIHQYCAENDIDDTNHNENFQEQASRHGLAYRGTLFTEEAKTRVQEHLANFNAINALPAYPMR